MNDSKVTQFQAFFADRLAQCQQNAEALRSEGREDEAIFEKIRANVYDIFRTVLSVAQNTCGEDAEAVGHFFRQRLQQIPTSWQAACEKAAAHGDSEKMHLEQLKLETLREIRTEFDALWEATL